MGWKGATYAHCTGHGTVHLIGGSLKRRAWAWAGMPGVDDARLRRVSRPRTAPRRPRAPTAETDNSWLWAIIIWGPIIATGYCVGQELALNGYSFFEWMASARAEFHESHLDVIGALDWMPNVSLLKLPCANVTKRERAEGIDAVRPERKLFTTCNRQRSPSFFMGSHHWSLMVERDESETDESFKPPSMSCFLELDHSAGRVRRPLSQGEARLRPGTHF